MLTTIDILAINSAIRTQLPGAADRALHTIGDPSSAEIVAVACESLSSDDRNVRVAMLRVLAYHPIDAAVTGVVAGLNDPERRVREVAIKTAKHFLDSPAVAARLASMVTDDSEKHKLRNRALDSLVGVPGGVPVSELPAAAAAELALLARTDRYSRLVLERLLRLPLSNTVVSLLESYATSDNPDEAAPAQRALAGEVVINLGQINDETARRRIAHSSDLAYGQVFFWTPRSEMTPADPVPAPMID